MLLKEVVSKFIRDSAPRLAAALAYYTIFSFAPLLIIAVAVVGFVYGPEAAQGHIIEQLSAYMGRSAAQYVQQVVLNISRPGSGLTATIVSVVLLLWGASQIFKHLRYSLNAIWNIKVKEKLGILQRLKTRAFSFLLVLLTGPLLLASIAVGTAVTMLVTYFDELIPGVPFLWHTANFFLHLGIATCLFALIFKYVSNAKVRWNPAWVGALFTALLFSTGRILLTIYLSTITIINAYGAAASLVVILLWLYYSGMILFLGAEFTQVYAARRGTPIVPTPKARFLKDS
ncbi:MAG: YihY/virulence factor BrkB family protein [Chitinispirillaceae bacterium]